MVQNQASPTAEFVGDDEAGNQIEIIFYPEDDTIHRGTTLIGRGTNVIGGRRGPPPEVKLGDLAKFPEGNDLVVKIYWLEEKRMSEVEILKKAKECGQKNELITNHIPEVVCHRDPNFLCSSTRAIRQFLGLPIDVSASSFSDDYNRSWS